MSELQAENEQLGKENGDLKLVLHSKEDSRSIHLRAHQDDKMKQADQVHELQDKV